MRVLLAGGPVLILAWWIAGANAQEVQRPPATLGAPTAIPPSEPSSLATLGRPVAIATPSAPGNAQAINDRQVAPASFVPPLVGWSSSYTRGQTSDVPQPLPSGPTLDVDVPKQTSPPPTAEKLGPPRRMPDSHETKREPGLLDGRLHPLAPDNCDCDPSCCADACCPDNCGWFKRWFPCWQCEDSIRDTSTFWVSGEYLLWWIKGGSLPPLVTTSPVGTPRAAAGVLGVPGTVVLFGAGATSEEERSGGRFTAGFWFDQDQTLGLEGAFLFLGDRSLNFINGSTGTPILARPFFDVVTGRESSELVAFPGLIAGNVAVRSSSELWGAELNLRSNLWRGNCWRLDVLGGFRYLGLKEELSVNENLTVPSGALAGSAIGVMDSFRTRNNFYGGQIGLDFELRRGRWSLDMLGKIAFGDSHETATINGSTSFSVPGSVTTIQPGGLLAQPTNIGHFGVDRFAIVPEAGVKVSYKFTESIRGFVGYSFLYQSDVIRPGSVIDRGVNVTQLPSQLGPGMLSGPPRPSVMLRSTDFWAQGISFGLEFRW
jgi:hypothetical protein